THSIQSPRRARCHQRAMSPPISRTDSSASSDENGSVPSNICTIEFDGVWSFLNSPLNALGLLRDGFFSTFLCHVLKHAIRDRSIVTLRNASEGDFQAVLLGDGHVARVGPLERRPLAQTISIGGEERARLEQLECEH